MATVTKSIGFTGRDYSTITAWEAAIDNTTYPSAGTLALGECYDDTTFNESPQINNVASNVTEVVLSVASGERHDGTEGTGARIVRGTDTFGLATNMAATVNITVEWLEIDWNGNDINGSAFLDNQDSDGSDTTYANLIIHGTSASSGSGSVEGIHADARKTNVLNCIVYDIVLSSTSGSLNGIGLSSASSSNFNRILNCVVHGMVLNNSSGNVFGMNIADSTNRQIQNCISMETSGTASGSIVDYTPASFATATASHNMASDTTASGTGSLDSKTDTTQFVSVVGGSEDFHIKTGADAIDAGTDLGTTPAGVNIDIDGFDRDADVSRDPWDMGAHEFAAAVSALNPFSEMMGAMIY